MDLSELGFTKEDLQERVIERLCDQLLSGTLIDDEGQPYREDSQFKKKLDKAIIAHIDGSIAKLAETHILPKLDSLIENLTLQQTNDWGEKVGKPVTFIEYLAQRADAYMREEVDYNGRSRDEAQRRGDGYYWKASGTRVAVLIKSHLHYSIESAMKQALATANQSIVGGLEGAVKVALQNVQDKLAVKVETK